MTIDNTPLGLAREEGDADIKAREHPMLPTSEASKGSTRDFARISAKMVLRGVREAGLPSDVVDAMKKRMARWVNYLEAYERDLADLRANASVTSVERMNLRRSMRESRVSVFNDIFVEGVL